MVAGLEEITDGKLSSGDRVVNDLTPKERDIAMVFRATALSVYVGRGQHGLRSEPGQVRQG